ncbi:LysR substrate-binding domain-containing protein [Ramlibacter pallidus]|uniref:LysR family transcriptional regulator n=1 Tax=Ramlibacter pallidus TaxID=2780087 RepID=A0ABR9S649_9BURK|nr:LysR substrate-binding domain-containing protein [Ramlibacter pallidus]MBE7368995.1 LysR family transcriptional regulator [Ramlibacter pallidus]
MSESISSIRPRRALPSLVALRAFEAAAAHLSVQRAAAELHVTPTAVTHQIRALEEDLATVLFLRKPRQLVLTPAGTRLAEALREGLDTIAAGVRSARQDTPHRVVTLSATTAFAARWVLPRLGALHAACPQVTLRIHASEAVADLRRGDADLAIRFGDGRWPGLATQFLGEERYAVMCGPAVRLRTPKDLEKVPLIHFDWGANATAPATWPNWARKAGIPQPARWAAARTGLSFSDEAQAMSATLAGLGAGLLSLTLTEAERSSGMLVQPLGPVLTTGSYHLAAVEGHEDAPGVREVWAWIAAESPALRQA